MKGNRNLWSDSEINVLISEVKKGLKNNKSINNSLNVVSGKLGRTKRACCVKYYNLTKKERAISVKSEEPKTQKTIAPKVMKIIFHNGSTEEAKIVAQNESIIVATTSKGIITFEL